jgi:2-hydroxy-3-oxopropionate reductase
MQKIGFVGLGIMGRPMALNLLAAGTPLLVNDVNAAAVEAVCRQGGEATSLAEIGRSCDVVLTILPNGTIVQEVLFGPDGSASLLASGTLVIDMSSVTPGESQICCNRLAEQGVGFLDAPVSGGEPGAIDGTLAFMVGGERQDFERAMPYFNILGSSAVLVGASGAGSVTKLCNQIIVNMNIATVAEALTLATKAGIDPELVCQAIRGGLAGSNVLDAKAPMMIARNFKPGGKISINHKDIKNAMQTAHDLDVPLLFTSTLFEALQALKVSGHMDDDHSGIVQFVESLAGVRVSKL